MKIIHKISSSLLQWDNLLLLLFSLIINDVINVLKHSKCILFDYNAKLFKKNKGFVDTINFQLDIDNF